MDLIISRVSPAAWRTSHSMPCAFTSAQSRSLGHAEWEGRNRDSGWLWRRLLQEFQDFTFPCFYYLRCCHGHQVSIAIGLDP